MACGAPASRSDDQGEVGKVKHRSVCRPDAVTVRGHEISIGHGAGPQPAIRQHYAFGEPGVRRCRRSREVFASRAASATGPRAAKVS